MGRVSLKLNFVKIMACLSVVVDFCLALRGFVALLCKKALVCFIVQINKSVMVVSRGDVFNFVGILR